MVEKIEKVPNQKNMVIALRFLKEANLIEYWKKYVESQEYYDYCGNKYHWSDRRDLLAIFGDCGFTRYLIEHFNFNVKPYFCAYSAGTINVYHIFVAFVSKFYPKEFEELKENGFNVNLQELAEGVLNCGVVDFEGQKVKIDWSKT